jgi:pimeloyl-ACP methyl ester carboxylesterase
MSSVTSMSTVTSADGTVIDYESHGSGHPVVFVAGAVEYREINPHPTSAARLLAERGCTGVVYDRRGRGRSSDTPPWSSEREVEDVAALIATVGGAATLYSSSSGATIALEATLAGVGVTGLVLYEPPFFRGGDKTDQVRAVAELLAHGDDDGAMRYNLTDVVGIPAAVVDGMAHGPSWAAMCAVAPTLLYDLTALSAVNTDPDWSTRWAGIDVPVAVVSGSQTFPALAGAADQVAASIPGAERWVLEGQTHGPAPEAIADAVTRLHAGSSAGGAALPHPR